MKLWNDSKVPKKNWVFSTLIFLALIHITPVMARCLAVGAVTDGDTFKVTIPHLPSVFGENIPVRLIGVDAPEIRSKRRCERLDAIEAKYFVKSILENAKCVTLYGEKRDKYFRILGSVDVDGKDLSKMLTDKGLAVSYGGKTKRKWKCRN